MLKKVRKRKKCCQFLLKNKKSQEYRLCDTSQKSYTQLSNQYVCLIGKEKKRKTCLYKHLKHLRQKEIHELIEKLHAPMSFPLPNSFSLSIKSGRRNFGKSCSGRGAKVPSRLCDIVSHAPRPILSAGFAAQKPSLSKQRIPNSNS